MWNIFVGTIFDRGVTRNHGQRRLSYRLESVILERDVRILVESGGLFVDWKDIGVDHEYRRRHQRLDADIRVAALVPQYGDVFELFRLCDCVPGCWYVQYD